MHSRFDNLETFTLIWFGANVNNDMKSKLRNIINQLNSFQDNEQWQRYIETLTDQDRIILVICDQSAYKLLHRVHNYNQLSAVYLYGLNQKVNKIWSQQFHKVNYCNYEMNLQSGKIEERLR